VKIFLNGPRMPEIERSQHTENTKISKFEARDIYMSV